MQIKHFGEKGNEKVNDMGVKRQKGIKQICKGHHLQIYRTPYQARIQGLDRITQAAFVQANPGWKETQ